MTEENKPSIIFNDNEILIEDLDDNQKLILSHLTDIEQKINRTQMDLDQLIVGKNSFMGLFEKSFEKETEE